MSYIPETSHPCFSLSSFSFSSLSPPPHLQHRAQDAQSVHVSLPTFPTTLPRFARSLLLVNSHPNRLGLARDLQSLHLRIRGKHHTYFVYGSVHSPDTTHTCQEPTNSYFNITWGIYHSRQETSLLLVRSVAAHGRSRSVFGSLYEARSA